MLKISQGNTTASDITGDIDDGGVSQFSVTESDVTVNARKKAIENHNIDKYAEYFYSITA